MTISPNGVSLSNYDPRGLGGILLAGTKQSDMPERNLVLGQIVDAQSVKLRAAGTVDYPQYPDNSTALLNDEILEGKWMVLGFLHLSNKDVNEAATLFLRVE